MERQASESPTRRKDHRTRRIVMILIGVGVGALCRLMPPEYQGPCGIAAKLLSVFLGSP